MPLFPPSPLDKAKLRSLLADLSQERLAEGSLSGATLRKTQEWAIAAHLLTEQGLTHEGRLAATKDPYLEATVTDWLIHFHLSSREQSLWNYFVYEFLPEYPSFQESELFNHSIEKFTLESPDQLKKNIRLLLKTYTDSQAIAKNKFLSQEKKRYSIGNSDLSNPYTTGYLLAKFWEQQFRSQRAVFVDQIVDTNAGLTSVLGINSEQLRQQLDNLAQHEIIEKRSARPHLVGTKSQRIENELSYQVHRCWESPLELLEKAYKNDIATPNRPLIQSLGSMLDDEDLPDLSQFLEWASGLVSLEGGSKTIVKLAS